LSDVVALAGGLASLGVVSAGSAALSVLLRRRSLSAKVEELGDLKQKIAGDKYSEISGEALVKMLQIIEARMQEQEQRMTRMGWRQGAVYTIFATAVAVLLVVFGHWVPLVR
jgi:hypothetical protein